MGLSSLCPQLVTLGLAQTRGSGKCVVTKKPQWSHLYRGHNLLPPRHIPRVKPNNAQDSTEVPPSRWPHLSAQFPSSKMLVGAIPRPMSPELTTSCSAQLWDQEVRDGYTQAGSGPCAPVGALGWDQVPARQQRLWERLEEEGRSRMVGLGWEQLGNGLTQALTSCVLWRRPWILPHSIHHCGILSDPGPLPGAQGWGLGAGTIVSVAEILQLAALQACLVLEADRLGRRRPQPF